MQITDKNYPVLTDLTCMASGDVLFTNRNLCVLCLTELAVVVHQDDLVQQVGRRSVQHTVDSPEQGGERLIEETDHHAGRG